jgi:hypothetical protein
MGKRKIKQNLKRQRKIESLELIQERYYIFCEGEQTEPRYFQSIKGYIDENPIYKNMIIIEIEGCGAETMRVIKAAEDYISANSVKEGQVWLVYDKDSFPAERFNGVSERANNLNQNNTKITYNVAWSNECVEYWFVLHFAYYSSNNNRKYYSEFLDKQLSDLRLPKYDKKDIFDILLKYGDPKKAIRFAKKQIEENSGKTDAEIAPATKVYLLVEELAKYFPEDIKSKFI